MLDRPILYQSTSDPLNTLGFGVMTGLTDWRIKSERNMVPVLTADQDVKNYLTPEIKNDRVIMADASDKRLNQLFKIDKVTDNVDEKGHGVRSIEAHHIVGELVKNSIIDDISLVNANPTQFWDALMKNLSSTDINSSFKFHTDIVTTANVNLKWKDVSTLQDVLFEAGTGSSGDKTNTFISLYDGEWYFDNFDIYFLKNAGEDNGLIVNYGQNLKTLSQEESIQNTYTVVQGYATQKKQSEKVDPITNAVDYTGAGLVQYLGNGGLAVYESPNGPQTGRYIQNGQHVRLVKQYVDDKNIEWLQLLDGTWILGKHVTVDKKGSWISNSVIGQGHIKWNVSNDGQGNIYETVNGVLIANYIFGDVPVYEAPTRNSKIVKKLDTSITSWKVFYKTKDNDGITWYNLGGNQWISNLYVEFDKQSAFTYEPARGVGTVDHNVKSTAGPNKGKLEGVAIWNQPGKPNYVVKYVYHGQRYKIFKVAKNDNTTWYNLGGNQWIQSQFMKFDVNNRDVEPKTQSDLSNFGMPTPKYSGKVVVYSTPGYQQVSTGQFLYSGDLVTITQSATVEHGTWYYIKHDNIVGWINGSYVDFGQDTDVDPYDPSQDIVIETKDQDVTLTLPEIFIKSPNADKFENQKVLKVDLSQYNVDTVDKLREVVNAYIYDNRIGEPETDLTVEYYQMRGKYARLNTVDICYRATIHYEQLDINKTAEVTSCEWNGPKKRWESIHFGKRPETLRDTLDKFLEAADDSARTQISNTKQQIDKSIEIEWDKFHDESAQSLGNLKREFNKGFATAQGTIGGLQTKIAGLSDDFDKEMDNIRDQIKTVDTSWRQAYIKVPTQKDIDDALKNYQKNVDDEVNKIKNSMSDYVKTHIADGKITYGTDEITATTNDGHHIGIGAGGIVFTDSQGVPTNLITADGRFNSDLINVHTLTGVDLYSATIHTGSLDAGVQIQAPVINGGSIIGATVDGKSFIRSIGDTYTVVMSSQYGISINGPSGRIAIDDHRINIGETSVTESMIKAISELHGATFKYVKGFKGLGLYYHDDRGDHFIA